MSKYLDNPFKYLCYNTGNGGTCMQLDNELLIKFSKLSDRQKCEIYRKIEDFIFTNKLIEDTTPYKCPVCGKKARVIKKGKQNGKQRYCCCNCHHKFTYDSNTITSCMKITKEEFLEICMDTISMIPIAETAKRLHRSIPCVFNNRHKFLYVLEHYLASEVTNILSGTVEIDETYVLNSEKGSKHCSRIPRHRGEPAKHRGLSKEYVCIVTSTDRNTHEVYKAVGTGAPSSELVKDNFKGCISQKSVIYCDGTNCYNDLAEITDCKKVNLESHKSYNKVEHINTVNCIHSVIKSCISFYRNVASKYINRYLALFVFQRRVLEDDDWLVKELLLKKYRMFDYNIPIKSLQNTDLFAYSCY